MPDVYEPRGLRFYDKATERQMLLVHEGELYAGWLCYRHPDGQWVTLRKATDDDIGRLNKAVSAGHHEPES